MAALNPQAIAAAQVGEDLWDDLVPGLHMRVLPSGRKVFYLHYRSRTKERRQPKLGELRTMSLADARRVAREILQKVAAGEDPVGDWKNAAGAPTVAELADRYWERHAKRQKSHRDVRRHLDVWILPKLGSMRVADIAYEHAEKLHDAVARKGPVQANRVLATFSKMLTLAERWQMRPVHSNPCSLVQRTREEKRRRHMTGAEAPAIAAALRAREKTHPASVAFLYLLVLSGARKGEIAAAKWDWLHGSVLRLPDSKTGARDVHLPQQALDVLAKLPRTTGTITGIKDPHKLWEAVRAEAGCPDLRMHDLRRSFASAALSAGLTLSQVGELLGHRNSQTTKGYAYLMEEAATAAATVAANKIESLMKAKA